VLAAGALAGLGSLLRLPAPVARAAAPGAPRLRSFGLDVAGEDFRAGRITAVLRAPARFDLVGARGAGIAGAGLEIRVRRPGRGWSPWVPLRGVHGPDRSSGPGAGAIAPTDPVWAGGARELQLRSRRPVGGVRLHFVSVGRAPARARAAQATGPTGPSGGPTGPTGPTGATGGAAAPPTPPAIISRHDWGGDQVKPRAAPSYGQVQVAFVHHTVSANDYGPQDSPGIVLAIAKYHRDTNGWNDIGYNFLVDKYGQVFEGRAGGIDLAVVGAHAQGYNDFSTGVSNIGTYSAVAVTEQAMAAMSQLLAWKMSLHGAPTEGEIVVTSGGGSLNSYARGEQVRLNRICGHRDGDRTSCPGDALYAQLPELRRRATALAGPVPQQPTLSLEAPDAGVPYGDPLRASGVLRGPDGTPAGGTTVSVQKQGSAAWVTLTRVTTDRDGTWSVELPWRRGGKLRAKAVFPGGPAALSPVVEVGVVPVLQAVVTSRRVRLGHSPLVTGMIRPVQAVYLRVERQQHDGSWVRTGDVTVQTPHQKFQVRVRLQRPGLYRITPRTPGPAGGAGPVVAAPLYVRAVRRRRR